MTTATPEHSASLWPPLLWFSLAYLAASAVVTVILVALDVNSNSGVSAAILVAATAAAAQKFVAANRRPLSRGEQLRFALLATVALVPLSLLQLAAVGLYYLNPEELPQIYSEAQVWAAENATFIAIIAVVVVLFSFAVVYFSSGWLSRTFDKRLAAAPPA